MLKFQRQESLRRIDKNPLNREIFPTNTLHKSTRRKKETDMQTATDFHSQRKAGHAAKQSWPADRKAELVVEGLRGRRPIAELCREAGVSTTLYYQWRQECLDSWRAGFAHPEADYRKLEERVRQLEVENASLEMRLRLFRDMAVAD
jgi:transposase-like protein